MKIFDKRGSCLVFDPSVDVIFVLSSFACVPMFGRALMFRMELSTCMIVPLRFTLSPKPARKCMLERHHYCRESVWSTRSVHVHIDSDGRSIYSNTNPTVNLGLDHHSRNAALTTLKLAFLHFIWLHFRSDTCARVHSLPTSLYQNGANDSAFPSGRVCGCQYTSACDFEQHRRFQTRHPPISRPRYHIRRYA